MLQITLRALRDLLFECEFKLRGPKSLLNAGLLYVSSLLVFKTWVTQQVKVL